jgi:hypothetical protein
MEAMTKTCGTSFGAEHFGAAVLGDKRRTKRLVLLADRMAQHPGGTLPHKFKDPAMLKALYRLVNAQDVTHEAVLAPHRERTKRCMAEHDGTLLIIHDSTELDYTGKTTLTGLGQIGNGFYRGYICHNSLVVDPQTREVVGLAQQILHRRPKVKAKRETVKQRRERSSRESRLWLKAVESIGPAAPGHLVVDVCDRGGDTFEFMDYERCHGRSFVVRSGKKRTVQPGHEGACKRVKLHRWVRTLPELGRRQVKVNAQKGQQARTAEVALSAAAVRLLPPKQRRGEHSDDPLPVWIVRVWEVTPPAGEKGLEWFLFTEQPVACWNDAQRVVGWYECRPIVEEYHKAQKTGCGIEQMQFTNEERMQPAIALISVVALTLLWLRDAARQPDAETRSATELLSSDHVETLSLWRHGAVRPLSIKEFFYALARLGGHQNRKHDHQPGWIVLWRGWTTLQNMLLVPRGARAKEQKRCG